MNFEVLLLGTNSATPHPQRFTTSQVLTFGDSLYLIDAGEGCQIRLAQNQVKRSKINHIFISHLHGDHIYGLPGVIASFRQFSRKKPLSIYGPKGLDLFINTCLQVTQNKLEFDLILHIFEEEKSHTIKVNQHTKVTAFPMKHRIETFGYRFDYDPAVRNIKPNFITKFRLTVEEIKKLKRGNDVIRSNGSLISADECTYNKYPSKSYAFCSDTVYDENLLQYISHVDALYHETTYLDDLEKEAEERMHTTIGQAIRLATKASAKKLITGHYSSRYKELSEFQRVADASTIDVEIGDDNGKYIF